MNLAELAIRNRTVTLVLTFVLLGGGLASYQSMSRLEDPEFTIKDALVITPYPGASAADDNDVFHIYLLPYDSKSATINCHTLPSDGI